MKTIASHLFCTLLLLVFISALKAADSDIEKIKKRVVTELMKPGVDDSQVARLVDEIRADGTWPGIDYENVSREGFEHRFHSANMVTLARAYQSQSSKHYKKK